MSIGPAAHGGTAKSSYDKEYNIRRAAVCFLGKLQAVVPH